MFLGLNKKPDKPAQQHEQDLSELLAMLQPMG